MKKYAPTIKDLAPRDMVSRAIETELQEGRGINCEGYVHLDLTQIDPQVVEENLSEIAHLSRVFLGVDPTLEQIPISPTCHYMMGGIPTDDQGRVIKNDIILGLYSAGESACVSVHGANRLGCNSLIDLVVFGKRAGKSISNFVKRIDWPKISSNIEAQSAEQIQKTLSLDGNERVPKIREDLQSLMSENCSIFRDRVGLEEALERLEGLKDRYQNLGVVSKGRVYNYELKEALELKNMLIISEIILRSALAREESRGAHYRTDFPKRDDKNWLKHTQVTKTSSGLEINYKPVTITKFQPKERTY